MFVQFAYLRSDADNKAIYSLNDTTFNTEIITINDDWSGLLIGIFEEYKRRNLPIVKNVARVILIDRCRTKDEARSSYKRKFDGIRELNINHDILKYENCIIRQALSTKK